jgi:beta-lactamase class A
MHLLIPLFLSQPVLVSQMPNLTPQAALERLFTAPTPQADWFAESFLSQVPLAQVEQILAEVRTSLGTYQSVEPDGENYRVIFEKGQVAAQIALSSTGQITGLLLQPISEAIAPDEAIQQLKALPGQTNLLILEGDRPIATHDADQPLAVGSTFKLAVLSALQQQINRGQRQWSDVIALKPEDKSLPSGILQNWFDGALLTLQTLATLMISQSDNTATDALIHLVGRDAVEAFSQRNRPFLTTREAFVLKNPENAPLLERYRQGDRAVLSALAASPLPDPSVFDDKPVALDVEWFFTPRELCTLMGQVADLPLMSVNPGGLAEPSDWKRIAYKGGSEPGVLNLTTWLEASDGKTYCVSATWNDPDAALAETRFFTLYSGILKGIRPPK